MRPPLAASQPPAKNLLKMPKPSPRFRKTTSARDHSEGTGIQMLLWPSLPNPSRRRAQGSETVRWFQLGGHRAQGFSWEKTPGVWAPGSSPQTASRCLGGGCGLLARPSSTPHHQCLWGVRGASAQPKQTKGSRQKRLTQTGGAAQASPPAQETETGPQTVHPPGPREPSWWQRRGAPQGAGPGKAEREALVCFLCKISRFWSKWIKENMGVTTTHGCVKINSVNVRRENRISTGRVPDWPRLRGQGVQGALWGAAPPPLQRPGLWDKDDQREGRRMSTSLSMVFSSFTDVHSAQLPLLPRGNNAFRASRVGVRGRTERRSCPKPTPGSCFFLTSYKKCQAWCRSLNNEHQRAKC